MIAPNTNIRLLKLPFEIDKRNQLTFTNLAAQTAYFEGLTALEYDNTTYQRQNNIIRFEAPIDDIREYNYVMYKNESYTNKWFYAYITHMEYKNDHTTDITIETDVWQTWQFDIVYKKMFVEREHVNDDTIGLHTIPEGLELGEYICDGITYDNTLDSFKYIVRVTEWTNGTKVYATNYGGVMAAGGAYICDTASEVVSAINSYASQGKEDAVISVYMCPSYLISNTSGSAQYSGQTSPNTYSKQISKPSTLDTYTPKNKKLLTFPFCYLNVSNNNGSNNTYMYELFNDTACNFQVKGVPVIGTSTKIIPYKYKTSSAEYNEEEGLMGGKFPTLSWSSDEYINWLTQNSVNIGLGIASNVITMAGGVGLMASGASGLAGAGSVVSGAMGIANTMGEVYKHSLTPNSARGNINGGDINVSSSKNGFYFYKISIKREYAKIIDNFFNMYGYKVNDVKIPNITGRTYWNYVKTIDCNIEGEIPQEDMQEIKDIFNNGVTFWHDASKFLDYSQNNTIVV